MGHWKVGRVEEGPDQRGGGTESSHQWDIMKSHAQSSLSGAWLNIDGKNDLLTCNAHPLKRMGSWKDAANGVQFYLRTCFPVPPQYVAPVIVQRSSPSLDISVLVLHSVFIRSLCLIIILAIVSRVPCLSCIPGFKRWTDFGLLIIALPSLKYITLYIITHPLLRAWPQRLSVAPKKGQALICAVQLGNILFHFQTPKRLNDAGQWHSPRLW